MNGNAHSDAVKQMAASIRRHAVVVAIKRKALAAASLACDRPDEPSRSFAYTHSTTQALVSKLRLRPQLRLRPLFVIANDNAARTLMRGLIRRKVLRMEEGRAPPLSGARGDLQMAGSSQWRNTRVWVVDHN